MNPFDELEESHIDNGAVAMPRDVESNNIDGRKIGSQRVERNTELIQVEENNSGNNHKSRSVNNAVNPLQQNSDVGNAICDVGDFRLDKPLLVDVESGGPFTEYNIDAPAELHSFIRERIDIPKQLLARHLLAGERVVSEFDIFYNERRLSKHFRIYLCLMTCGLYFLYLCFVWLWRSMKRYCCVGDSFHQRGKLAITSTGRVLFWTLKVDQKKNVIEQRAHYQIAQCTHVCSIRDLKQMKITYYDSGLICDFCCKQFSTGLEVSFFAFKHLDQSPNLHIESSNSFVSVIKRFIFDANISGFQQSICDPFTITIVSTQFDKYGTKYQFDRGQESLEYLVSVSHALMGYANCYADSSVGDAFLPAKSAASNAEECLVLGPGDIMGVREICQQWHGFQLIMDTEVDQVTVPVKWMPLLNSEKVIAAVGEVYFATCFEKLLCILTFGLYYLFVLRKKMMQSNAYILTTKRLVHVTVHQRYGKIPVSMGNVIVEVASYFPGKEIAGGYIRSLGKRLISALQTEAGCLALSLPNTPEALQFVHRMHQTVSRSKPLNKSPKQLKALVPELIAPYFDDRVSRRQPQQVLSAGNTDVLPLLSGETILHKIEGSERYAPCCVTSTESSRDTQVVCGYFERVNCCCLLVAKFFLSIWEFCGFWKNFTPANNWQDLTSTSYLCNFHEAGFSTMVHSLCVKCLTLGTRPLMQSSDVYFTSNSMLYASVTHPSQCVSPDSRQRQAYFVCWVPIRRMLSFKSTITAHGAHGVYPCCCGLCCMLPDCNGNSRYEINLQTSSGYSYVVSGHEPTKNWLADEDYVKSVAMVGVIHSQVSGASKPLPEYLSAL